MIDDLLAANEQYAQHGHPTGLTGRAARGICVVTCMDSRIEPLAMLGLTPGDAKILRNAGGRVTDDVLRGLILATNLLGVHTILLIQHTDCRMTSATDAELQQMLGARHGVDASGWEFLTIRDQPVTLAADAQRIRDCPLIDLDVTIETLIYDVESGRLSRS